MKTIQKMKIKQMIIVQHQTIQIRTKIKQLTRMKRKMMIKNLKIILLTLKKTMTRNQIQIINHQKMKIKR